MREWSERNRMKLKVLIMKNNEKGICEWYEKISIHENSDCESFQCEGERQKGKHSRAQQAEVYAFVVWMLDASEKLLSRLGRYLCASSDGKISNYFTFNTSDFCFFAARAEKFPKRGRAKRMGKVTKKSFSTPRLSTSGEKFITKRWHIRLCAVGDAKRDKTSLLIWKKVRNRKIKSLGTSRNNGTRGKTKKNYFSANKFPGSSCSFMVRIDAESEEFSCLCLRQCYL